MNHARIIKLDSPLTVISSNFEEAFGEYSNMSAKRKARILKRQKDRQDVRAARTETKVQRQENRSKIKSARIAKRRKAMSERQDLRDERKTRRKNRKAIGKEEEEENGAGEPIAETETEQEGGGGQFGGGGQGGGGGQFQYDEEETGGDEGSSDEYSEEETPPYDEESGADGYYDSFASADGINYEDLGSTDDLIAIVPDDFYTYESGSANPDGEIGIIKQKISPEIKDIAQKSEWNKEMVLQLNNKVAAINNTLDKGVSSDQAIPLAKTRADLMSKAEISKDRAVQFDGMMSDYVNFDGFDNDNSGGEINSYASGKKRNPKKMQEKTRRIAEVTAAKREAMKSRKKMILNKMKRSKMATKIAKGLKPEFDTQKITIPAADLTTGADGETGLIAIDNANDFDSPPENTFTFSNASGTSAKKWGGILLGALVIGAAIWYGKKKKLF